MVILTQRLVFHAGLYALGLLIVAKLLVFVGDSPGVRAYPGLTQNSDLESDEQDPRDEIYRAGLGAILAQPAIARSMEASRGHRPVHRPCYERFTCLK